MEFAKLESVFPFESAVQGRDQGLFAAFTGYLHGEFSIAMQGQVATL
jgi:hypothetical protein